MRMNRLVPVGVVVTLGVVITLLIQDGPDGQSFLPDQESPSVAPGAEAAAGPARSVTKPVELIDAATLAREEQRPVPGAFGSVTDLPPDLLSAEIRVWVEQESGEPVAGAALELALGVEQLRFSGWSIDGFRLERTSDADGLVFFQVPPVGVYTVSATREGFAPSRISPVLPGDDLKLPMNRGRSLTGRVLGLDTGAPIVGAALRVLGAGLRQFTVSDGEGGFQFRDLADGPVRLDVLAEGFDLKRIRDVDPDGERDGPLRVELSPGVDFHGKLVDAVGGRPIAAASVRLQLRRGFDGNDPAARTTRTDTDGEFHFTRISRSGLELALTAEGYADSVQALSLEPEVTEATRQFSLAAEAQVSGLVLRWDGSTVEGAEVTLHARSRQAVEDRTVASGPEGRFLIAGVLPGERYELRAVHREEQLAPSETQAITVTTAGPLPDFEIILEAGAGLSGRVVDAVGQPVPYAQVVLEDLPARTWRALKRSPVLFADEQGEFRFEGLPGALARISARSGEAVSEKLEVGLISGSEQEILLSLGQGLSLSGVVVDTGGLPIPEALVSVFATLRDFRLPRPPVKPRARTAQVGERSQKQRQRVKQKQIDKLLERDRTWRLFRSATGGRNGGGETFRGLARTDSSGAFTLSGLIHDQRYVLVVRKQDFDPVRRYGLVPDEVAGARSFKREIVLSRLLALTGMVVNSHTRSPVVRFRVAARPVGDPKSHEEDLAALLLRRPARSSGFRSEDGSFELSGLRPGAYELTIRAQGFRTPRPIRVNLPELPGARTIYSLTPASQVSGHVRTGNGTALSRVPVFLVPQAGPPSGSSIASQKEGKRARREKRRMLRRTTDRNGDYLFNSVPPGEYQIGLGRPNSPLAGPLSLFVEEGGRVERDFRFDAVGSLLVEVRSIDGFGLRKARVRLRGRRTGASYSLSTDESGRVEFSNILAEEYILGIHARGYESMTALSQVQAGDRISRFFSLKPRK